MGKIIDWFTQSEIHITVGRLNDTTLLIKGEWPKLHEDKSHTLSIERTVNDHSFGSVGKKHCTIRINKDGTKTILAEEKYKTKINGFPVTKKTLAKDENPSITLGDDDYVLDWNVISKLATTIRNIESLENEKAVRSKTAIPATAILNRLLLPVFSNPINTRVKRKNEKTDKEIENIKEKFLKDIELNADMGNWDFASDEGGDGPTEPFEENGSGIAGNEADDGASDTDA